MKILVFSHLSKIEEYATYVKALKSVNPVQSILLTMGREEYEFGQEVGAFDVVKDILPALSEIDAGDAGLSRAAQSLKELEDRTGHCFVNRDILMDRYFRGQPSLNVKLDMVPLIWNGLRTKNFMCAIYKRLEEEIGSFDPDFIFVETNTAPTRMAWRLAREKGVPAGVFLPVRFWSERVYLETGIGLDWRQARITYTELADRPMSGAELEQVKQRLQTILHEKIKPTYMQWDYAKGAPSFFKRLHPKRLFSGLNDWLGARARTFMRNPWVLPSKVFSPFGKFARYRNGLKAKRYLLKHQRPFSQIRTKRYAIYFLHVQPELTVEEMAFEYQDQVNTLRNIMASLPADMYVVVKEHLPMLGYRPLEVYNELVHLPGIIIADTREDSHKLIAHASVVVTLTGTVALEAVLYGIPAIVLGSVFFDSFNGIYKPGNLHELKKLLSNPEKLLGATEEEALRALGSMLRASVPGRSLLAASRPQRWSRVYKGLDEIDFESAKVMMSELQNACQESKYSESN